MTRASQHQGMSPGRLDRTAQWYWELDCQLCFTRLDALEDRDPPLLPALLGTCWTALQPLNLQADDWRDQLDLFDARQPFFNLELQLPGAGGDTQWLSLCGVPLTDAQGNYCGYRGVGKDISRLKNPAPIGSKPARPVGKMTLRPSYPVVDTLASEQPQTHSELLQALAQEQLLLYYQPIVDLQRTVVGYEALLRWNHPVRGIVAPNQFIDIAEQTGLIVPIGEWAIAQACQQLTRFAADSARRDLTIAVNLSAFQLAHPNLVPAVKKILQHSGAPASRLKLEITESMLLRDMEKTVDTLQQLSTLGIRFSLDDFGTGYSSLSYLKKLPLSVLKVDQSFVKELLIDPVDAAIVKTILQLAKSLGLSVIAEGVELEGQRKVLADMGCQWFQGYLFGKPALIS